MGIDSNRIVCAEHVPPETFCPVCDDLIDPVDAVQAVPCGHLFCFACIEGVVRVHGQCPQDRQPLTLQQLQHAKEANPFVYRLLGRALIKCIRHEDGCMWTGEVSETSSHTLTCGKESVACPRCRLWMLREALSSHQEFCHTCKECEEKDAELEALREEMVQSQHLADELHALQAQQQEERVHDANFPYDRCTAAEAGVLVAENLRGHRPRHVDRSKLFTAVKRLAEAWSRHSGDHNRPSDADLHFLLTACTASSLFHDGQREAIHKWTVKVCLRVIDVDAM